MTTQYYSSYNYYKSGERNRGHCLITHKVGHCGQAKSLGTWGIGELSIMFQVPPNQDKPNREPKQGEPQIKRQIIRDWPITNFDQTGGNRA
jgi:hypothetical protein